MPQVRAVVRGAAKDNYKLSSIVLGIVNTDAFRKQGPASRSDRRAPMSQIGSKLRGYQCLRPSVEWSLGDHMFITKKHLSRRTVLKGAGVTLALPLLDAMVPAATALAQTAAAPKMRAGFFYIPHGAIMDNTSHGPAMDKWTPSGSGADFKLSPILARSSRTRSTSRLSAISRTRPPRARCTRSIPRRGSAPRVRTPAAPGRTWPRLSIR